MPAPENDRPELRRGPWWLYGTFFVGWAVASVAIVRGAQRGHESMAPAWFFVAGTGILVLALVERDTGARRRARDLLLERENLIASIGVVTDPRLSQLPLYQLLDELLGRARGVLGADTAVVFLHDPATGRLTQTAASGLAPDTTLEVDLGDGVVGRVAASRRGVAMPDAGGDPTGSASIVAAPLVAEGQLIGVVHIGTRRRREFGGDDLRLLQVVADRAAVAIDATRHEREAQRALLAVEGARRRLALLADAGEVLAGSYERVEEMTDALAASLVPKFFDVVVFHQLDATGSPSLASWQVAPETSVEGWAWDGWEDVVPLALESAVPVLAWGDTLLAEQYRAVRRLGLSSVIVAPIRIRGVTLGVTTFGTLPARRGLRPGDVATVSDLSARTAVAIERVLLGGETQASAVRAARRAAQLQRLAEGAFAINAALATPALSTVIAEQARGVLEADAAWVELNGSGRIGEAGRAAKQAHTTTSPLTDAAGSAVGSVSVARTSAPFSAEDQAILGSLAQLASVASANASLYTTAQESEARLRALYDASPVGIVELDERGVAQRWNRAAERLFGWQPFGDDAVGHAVMPEDARDVVTQALAADTPRTSDVRVTVDGEVIEAELFAVPLQGPVDERRVVLAAVDVTERKQVAEQLQQAQRMEAMGRMAGGIAHDFNNVLMVVTGYADLLLRRDLDPEVEADIEAMRTAAGRAAELTRKLLTISRRQVVQAQVVDVGAAVTALEDVLGAMVGDRVKLGIEVRKAPHVLIDPAQLEQVIVNLSINARDAMAGGGTLMIRVHGERGTAVLEVSDTGEGMEPATAERCFEPFFTTKERTKGSGLGLSTVYSVVTQAGGEITVDSTVGEGTTFVVRLPQAPAEEAPKARGRPALSKRSLRILVVDDEPDVRAIVRDMLELDDHDVVVAPSARAALTQLAKEPVDLLLSDVEMPRMRGTELAKRVEERWPDTRVVLMSSHVDDDLALSELPDGMLFLAKPFTAEALRETIDAARRVRARSGTRRRGPS